LRGSNEVAVVDLSDLDCPRLEARWPLPRPCVPGPVAFGRRGDLLVADAEGRLLWSVELGGGSPSVRPLAEDLRDVVEFMGPRASAWTLGVNPGRSSLEILEGGRWLGRLPLRGPTNLGGVRPMGLAFAPRGRADALIAVADRSGGVHLVELRAEA